MKKILVLGFLLSLSLMQARAWAQESAIPSPGASPKTKDSIFLEAGSANDSRASGFQFGGGYGFGLERNFYLVLSTQYYTSSQSFQASNSSYGNSVNADFDVWTALANLRVNFTDRDNPVVFYGIAGCGPGLLMRGSTPYFPSANIVEPMSQLGIGIDIHLFKKVSLFVEEGFVFQFAGLPLNPYGAQNYLNSPDYPPVSFGLNLEPF